MLEKLKSSFYKPDNEFTPFPFWFWNDNLKKSEIKKQINNFKNKGVMGFIIHPRIGIPKEIQYLSDRFMSYVKYAVKKAAEYKMKVILYDEAMYPSGSAHGMVVKDNPEYASRGIKMIEIKYTDFAVKIPKLYKNEKIITILAAKKISRNCLNPKKIIRLNYSKEIINFKKPEKGDWSILIFVETFSNGTIRGIHYGEDDNEPNAPLSADILNPLSVKKFISITHERYYYILKEYFGNTIIAMFTDEPSILGRNSKPGIKPWTPGFLQWYLECRNLETDLPLLWFDVGKESENKRKNYFKAINKRVEYSYYNQISKWCENHGIYLTGHPKESDDIGLLKYFHIPGQDIVWRWIGPENEKGITGVHSTIGKCSSDAARHSGRRRNSNECFGCCGPDNIHWTFSMDDMKWYLDWLFVRGVNLIYPHAFYYSINGEKRIMERPPDVGPNNIWWKYYNTISDYIKRMCYLLTDSFNTTEIALLCESNNLPWLIANQLFKNQIEFNYLEYNIFLSESCKINNGYLFIQKQKYKILIIEDCELLNDQLSIKLNEFINNNGKVIIFNPYNKKSIQKNFIQISKIEYIVPAIEKIIKKDILLIPANDKLRVTHLIKNKVHFYILVNEGEKEIRGELKINNNVTVEKWDCWNGKIENLNVIRKNNYFSIPINLLRRESSVISINPSDKFQSTKFNKMEEESFEEFIINEKWILKGLKRKKLIINNLNSWTKWDGLKYYSGTLFYESKFKLTEIRSYKKIIIDLGKVKEIANIFINKINVGVKMWAPYEFDITRFVKNKINTIKVEVSNSLANRIYNTSLESGLIGPVKIIVIY